jgi:hypothetical protein
MTQDGERTRLVYRVRFSAPAPARVFTALFEPADFLSSRKMLIGIKRGADPMPSQRKKRPDLQRLPLGRHEEASDMLRGTSATGRHVSPAGRR